MQTEHSPFPSDETLAAYIDGRLDEETRKLVVEHMAGCAECLDIVSAGREMGAAAPVVRGVNWSRNVVFGLAAAAAVAIIFFLTPVRDLIWPRDDIKTLASVAPPKRLSDGRVSGFPYRERAARNRGKGNDDSDHDSLEFLSAAAEVQKRATDHPDDAAALHAEGVSYLVLGYVADAVKTLEDARQKETKPDPRLLNDLAAAYLAAGRAEDALTTANRAWTLAKTPEIAWNRALAAQRANHRSEAIAAWNDYLRISDSPQWTAEAQKYRDEVQSE